MSQLYQVGTLNAFLQGVYESAVSFETLSKKGDFGLGVLNALAGEMVAVDGDFYQIASNGRAKKVSKKACTPFSLVSPFKTAFTFQLNQISNINELNQTLRKKLKTLNIFYMIRIDAELSFIRLRSESCQKPPFHALAETLPNIQNIFECNNLKGTLVTSFCPDYTAAITIPGFHYHFIDATRKIGGHVFDLKLNHADVMVSPIREFHMILPNTSEFDNASANLDITSALKKIE